jgi:hypothetical protein
MGAETRRSRFTEFGQPAASPRRAVGRTVRGPPPISRHLARVRFPAHPHLQGFPASPGERCVHSSSTASIRDSASCSTSQSV